MVVKVLIKIMNTNNNPTATINYLCGRKRDRKLATVLRGDLENTLNHAVNFSKESKQSYSVGCLSFEESNIDLDKKIAVMNDFEKYLITDSINASVVWVEHRDKGRLELNFFIVQQDIDTGKHFPFYFHKKDKRIFSDFRDYCNSQYHFTNPLDLDKKQTLRLNHKLSSSRKEASQQVNELVESFIFENLDTVTSRDDIINYLKSIDLEITKQTEQYFTIKLEDNEKRDLRMKGGYYNESEFKQIINELKNNKAESSRCIKNEATTGRQAEAEFRKIKSELAKGAQFRSEYFKNRVKKSVNNTEQNEKTSDLTKTRPNPNKKDFKECEIYIPINKFNPNPSFNNNNKIEVSNEFDTTASYTEIITKSDYNRERIESITRESNNIIKQIECNEQRIRNVKARFRNINSLFDTALRTIFSNRNTRDRNAKRNNLSRRNEFRR